MDIFSAAKRYMRANGDPSQWGSDYPARDIVAHDIARGGSYVMLENGAWRLDHLYGTIHCLTSNGTARDLFKACFDFCTAQIDYLRSNTHADNRPMQQLLEKYGFQRGGIIHGARDGGARIAYDCITRG